MSIRSLLVLCAVIAPLGCAPIQSSVSTSAPHLPLRVVAKSAPRTTAETQLHCPAEIRHSVPSYPRDSIEASWRLPELAWRLSCPGILP